MQKLAEVCIHRPVFAVMLILALTVVGGVSYTKLGIDRFPNVDLPIVSVRTVLLGASPEEIESTVSRRIEDAVATVEGIDTLRSTSTDSLSIITATFNLKRHVDVAAQDMRDAVATVISLLPRDAKPPLIKKLDTDASPVMSLVLSGPKTPRELYEIADRDVQDAIESVSGVGQVQIIGGQKRAINIWVDADRLAAYRIPITRVRDAVARQNADIPGGRVDEGARELVLRTMGRFADPRLFNDLVVATIDNVPVRIRDLGYSEDGHKEQRTAALYDGKEAVSLQVRRQSGANSIEVIHAVKAKLERVRQLLPPGVTLNVVQDQSRYIEAAFYEVQRHLILGSILASLVVLAFMRNWRATAIAAVAIPASIVATFGMMRALNFTLNNITMLALVLMVGVVIDDAIVVLENIFRFIEEKRLPPVQAAVMATRDIGLAVMATTLSLVVIFLPVSFMSSVSGRFLYSFGVTAAVAILVSLLVSFSLTPMMSSRMLRIEDHGRHRSSRAGFYGRLDRGYSRLLWWAMHHRVAVAACAVAAIASCAPLYKMVRQEYIPTNVDESEFEMSLFAPEGASLASMEQVLSRINRELFALPGVEHVLDTVGAGYLGIVNNAQVFVRLTDIEERVFSPSRLWKKLLEGRPLDAFRGIYSQRDVMQALRARLKQFPDLRGQVRNVATLNQGSAPVDIDFVIRGPDLERLSEYSERLRLDAANIPGMVDIDTTLRMTKPELRVTIDRGRAADLGVDASDIAGSLRLMVGGDDEVSRYRDDKAADDYDVEVRLIGAHRHNAETVSKLYVPSRSGRLIRLDNLVKLEEKMSAYRIEGLDRQRQVAIRANVGPGYALADRLDEMQKAAGKLHMPVAYSTTVIGRGRELERTFGEFILAFALSIAFMYMILASQFESVVHPVTILLSLPLAVPFGFLSLWFFNDTLNLYSALGILVLFGVVKKNSILQIDHTNNLRREGMGRMDAIMQANRDRLRPILMTTLTLVAGMAPLALGTGPGAEERRSIAIVVIGGQSLSLLLTLIVTPVAYSIFDDLGAWAGRRRRAPEAAQEVVG
ncbi:MAG: efflux RND transporter permease subunit [Candidatus Solibacter usitatus]|nr:efflux RND transporter permease subunit [Candidatus Solibacter usitatus]